MVAVSLEQLLEIHDLLIQSTGGAFGVRDQGRLHSAIAGQTQAVFGKEVYSSLYKKAAALTRAIIADHPFVDGNKRTGMLVGMTFLQINDIELTFERGEIEEFAVRIAVEQLKIHDIAQWYKSHINE